MTKLDEFFAQEGGVKLLHSSAVLPESVQDKLNAAVFNSLPQWVKDLKSNHEEKSLIKNIVKGRMMAISIGDKDILNRFSAKYGFEYETPKNNILINNMDKNRGR